jgi:colanic acid/amylovoran biosynthesis protein
MIIELHGAQFYNKGSELMLRAVVAELGQRLDDVTFAVDPVVGPYEKRGELGLRQIVPPRWWMGSTRFRFGLAAQRIFSPLLKKYPLEKVIDTYGGIALDQIDALVDLSGFAFTDQWGPAPIQDFTRLAKVYKRKRKPVVMLPQGFGPFEKPESQKAMAELTKSVDLAYARDDISLRHIRSVASKPQLVTKAPDVTLFYPKKINKVQPAEDALYSCIIPNVRMLDQGKAEWGGQYENFLTELGDMLVAAGEQVRFLIHDTTGKDVEIARRVQREMDSAPEIVKMESPLSIKEYISRSRLVITSRYHGAVAAFSNAVPSICLGWSHKYQMLYKDFGCVRNIVKHDEGAKTAKDKVKRVLNKKENNKIREKILVHVNEKRDQTMLMWNNIKKELVN